jgi:hypothetical protein
MQHIEVMTQTCFAVKLVSANENGTSFFCRAQEENIWGKVIKGAD